MNSKELEELSKIKKEIEGAIENQKNERIKDILTTIKKFSITEEDLKKTGIGLVVGKLRSNSISDISNLSKELINNWKDEITKNKKKKLVSTPKNIDESKIDKVDSSPKELLSSPLDRSTFAAPSRTSSMDSASRTILTDNIEIKTTNDKARDKCIEMLYVSLATDNEEKAEHIMNKAFDIEAQVFQDFEGVNSKYKSKIRSLYLNLKDKTNPTLRLNVLTNKTDVLTLVHSNPSELASEEKKEEYKKIQEDNIFKARGVGQILSETDAFKCGKCKMRKCSYYQLQTRSADEPMTTFVTCLNCDNRWKVLYF